MAWLALAVVVPAEALDTVGARLFDLDAAGLQEDFLPGEAPPPRQPWDTGPPAAEPPRRLLRAWFEDPDRGAVEAALRALPAGEPTWTEVAEEDWETAWRRGFQRFDAGGLVVAPPWDAPEGALVVEPGRGFGTGAHPTTRQALRALVAHARPGGTALDVGCGSGILALAAAKLGMRARGVDVDEAAVVDARGNAARNGLDAAFSTRPVSGEAPADLVLANLYAEVLVTLAPELIRVTRDRLVLAGILRDREPTVRAAFSLDLEERSREGEWVCLVYRRRP